MFSQSSATLFKDAFSLSEGKFDREFLDNAKRFLELIMLRRVKDSPEVGFKIPEKTEVTLLVPLSSIQHSWYMRILRGCDQLLSEPNNSVQQKYLGGLDGAVEKSTPEEKNRYKVVRNMLVELRKVRLWSD